MLEKIWVLVADAGRARFFASDLSLKRFDERRSLIHSQSRLHESDAYSDDRGRLTAPSGFGRGGAAEPKRDLHSIEAHHFARKLNSELERAHRDGEFDKLVIVAPPTFLGILRRELSGAVGRSVETTVTKDYTQRPHHELGRLLGKHVTLRPRFARG